jgi:hypothetical protein
MYRVDGILIFFIILLILYILYLYFNRQGKIIFKWNDIPPEAFEGQQEPVKPTQPKSPLATNEDYRAFFNWHSTFCTVWNKVIEQSMSVDNYKGNPVDYVKNLQTQQNTIFVKCYDEITADPDPLLIQNKIPTVDLYLATMNFMAAKIASILQKTKDALAGKPQPEGFEDQQNQQCGCLSPGAAAAVQDMANNSIAEAAKKKEEEERIKKALISILSQIKPIVRNKATLEGQLTIVSNGLIELLEYKRKAETGEIQKDIKITN